MAISQRVVAGVSIDECVSVGAYGAVHKAHTASRRDLRALLVDARLSGDATFTAALLDDRAKGALTSFDHPSIVPTLSIARTGDDLVVVTVGPGRHTTVADLLAGSGPGGGGRTKLSVEVAGAIVQAVVQALAAAHQRGLVHGAVHARSVAIDDLGHVKLCDFAAGRALTEAAAQGADPVLLRGLTGSLPPEVALGDPPSAAGDVFGAGALLYTMLTGDPPPGVLRVTPAVERVVQIALDTDPARRFRDGTELLEALLEAYDDDRWSIADVGELRKLVLGRVPGGAPAPAEHDLDDDTEDLLASLGSAARNVPLTRPSIDIRAAAVAERQKTGVGKAGLDALLADLDPKEELTTVDDQPRSRRDPISEIIRTSIADLDEDRDSTPLPMPAVTEDSGLLLPPAAPSSAAAGRGKPKQRTQAPTMPAKPSGRGTGGMPTLGRAEPPRGGTSDELAALSAIADLDGRATSEPPAPVPAPVAPPVARSVPKPARPAITPAEPEPELPLPAPVPTPTAATPAAKAAPAPAPKVVPATVQRRRPVSAIEPVADDLAPPIRLKSRFWPIAWSVIIVGGLGVAVYAYLQQKEGMSAHEKQQAEQRAANEALEKRLREEQEDPGTIRIRSEPSEGTVWLLIGRTPCESIGLPSSMLHQLRVELDGYTAVDTQVAGSAWTGEEKSRVAHVTVPLSVAPPTKDGKPAPPPPFQPPVVPDVVARGPFPPGRGVIEVESTPAGAQVWLLVGATNTMQFSEFPAGKDSEWRVLKDGYLPGYVRIASEEWRKPGGDPKLPINAAAKHEVIEKALVLAPDPNGPFAPKDSKAPRPR